MVAATFSGGGARAAAFGLGVLRELRDTPIDANKGDGQGDHPATLLEALGLVSGVSGGSILAAYYAAFGEQTFTRFESDFLQAGFQDGLINQALMPTTLWRLGSPWYGRGNVLSDQLDELFQGKRFDDVMRRPGAPLLLVSATDLSTGAPFEFTPEQMALLCSDLAQVPLSFAVAASAAVPVLLSPLTLHNHAGHCGGDATVPQAGPSDGVDNFRTRMLRVSAESYRDARVRPYIHLVDGGVSDNLGVRPLLDRVLVDGSLEHAFRDSPRGSIRRVVLLVVNAERGIGERIDQSARVPGALQVMDTLVFGAGARETQVTLALLRDDLQRWSQELAALRGREGTPFAPDAEIHVIGVNLGDTGDPTLAQIPTAFSIAPGDSRRLHAAGRQALRQSPQFQSLLRGLPPSN
ncbi:patatin-like phospholipase family protein [Janthinobacterium aquaticum]|nr:patatin-like phospholipase family protein [Janthinobacterium sp. FT58W]